MALKTKLTRDQIEKLAQLDDAGKADLLSLFDEALDATNALDELRSKVPSDSQTVVDSDEYKRQLAAREEAETKIAALQSKLDDLDLRPNSDSILTMFNPICALFGTRRE